MSALPHPRKRNPPECEHCFDPLLGEVAEFNGAWLHPWCAEHAHNALCWPDDPPLPWRPTMRRCYRPDPDVTSSNAWRGGSPGAASITN